MVDLIQKFSSESKGKKIILVASLVAFVGMFLPWVNVKYYFFADISYTSNGWNGVGTLTGLASLAIIIFWVLSTLEVKIPSEVKEEVVEKAASILMIFGSGYAFLNLIFNDINLVGFGLYITLFASGVVVYSAFKNIKKTTVIGDKKNENIIKEEEAKK